MKKAFFAMMAMAAALSVQAETIELLTNGSGDSGTTGWNTYNFLYSSGDHYFYPTPNASNSMLWQDVTLSEHGIASDVIHSRSIVVASVKAESSKSSGASNVTVYQRDANGNTLETHLVMAKRAGETFSERDFTICFPLNAGACSLRYMIAAANAMPSGQSFRNCSLSLTQIDTTFRSQDETVATVGYWVGVSPEPDKRAGYSFLGYFTEETGGEQVYDANCEYVVSSGWKPTAGATLYAHWEQITFTFVSDGSTVGVAKYVDGDTAPIALKKGDDIFLGYYTAAEGGVKVYDENYEFVLADATLLTDPETTLYAQWKPVARTLEGGITRLVYRGVLTNFGTWTSGLKKTMHVKVYDSASAAEPLWSGDVADVPINPDGSFEAVFGNDELALAFASNDVTHVELTVGDALSPLAPRRAFASVASVNRALVAEGAANDIKVGTLGANALIAEKITAGTLEASETVRVEGSVSVEVKPFDIKRGQETTIWRGAGVTAWGDPEHVDTFNGVVAGQKLWTADRDGVVMIHCSGDPRSTLRIPATIQFVRPGDEVRAPTWDGGKVNVTVWGYKK